MAEAERLEADQPAYAAAMLVEAAVAHMMTGDMEALRSTAARAGALAAEPAPPLATLAELLRGEALAALGQPAEADPLLDHWRETYEVLGLATGAAEIVGMAGHASLWLERYDRAEEVLGTLVRAMRTASGFGSLPYPLAVQSHLHYRRGQWSAAYADAGEAVRLAQDLGVLSLLAHGAGALAEVEAATGREADCRAHATRALEITGEHAADASRSTRATRSACSSSA